MPNIKHKGFTLYLPSKQCKPTGFTLYFRRKQEKSTGFTFYSRREQVKSAGFTLIELLVVIAIIGILTGIGITSFSGAQIKSRDTSRKSDLNTIRLTLEQYFNKNGTYPCANVAGTGGACTIGTTPVYTSTDKTIKTLGLTPTYTNDFPQDPNQLTTCQPYYYGVKVTTVSAGVFKAFQYTLFAKLENPNDSDALASKTAPSILGGAASATKTIDTCIYNYWVSNP